MFRSPESPLRASELSPRQRLSYFASLAAYLAPPMRLLMLTTLAAVLWTGALPMKVSVTALVALWLPAVSLNLLAGSSLTRGYMKIGETAHYELMTMAIYTRALRCAVVPGRSAFKVTPKQGSDDGGWAAVMKLKLVILAAVALAGGTVLRLLDLAGIDLLPRMPSLAIAVACTLGLIELRRVLRTLLAVGRRRQRRQVYRFEGEAEARVLASGGSVVGQMVDASSVGIGLSLEAAVEVGERPAAILELEDANGDRHEIAAQIEIRSSRELDGRWLVGATIEEMDPDDRMRLMEWCYVVCSHERLRGRRPAEPERREAIVLPLPSRPSPRPAAFHPVPVAEQAQGA